jgi:guanylate kinase
MHRVDSAVLLVVAAPSGAGKTSLVNALLARHSDLHVSVSHTTRAQRDGEVDGVDYFFVDPAQFQDMVAADAFLEHACVFGNQYGTAAAAVANQLERRHDVVLEIDWQGARQIRAAFPDAVTVFILPPSRSALLERLRGRGQDDEQTIERRTTQAVDDMGHYDEFDHVVVNDDFETAVDALDAVLQGHRAGRPIPSQDHSDLLARLLSCAGTIE